jgi:hypothetical protein
MSELRVGFSPKYMKKFIISTIENDCFFKFLPTYNNFTNFPQFKKG